VYRTEYCTPGLAERSVARPASPPVPADPPPLAVPRGWTSWLGLSLSIALLAAALIGLRRVEFREVLALVPRSPAFWPLFLAYYFATPIGDWIIFRRLWGIPVSGLAALTRKLIGNEILLGYVGEVYFYSWARKRSRMTGSPFGAIKDVAVLSAIAGNAATLALVALAWPFLGWVPVAGSGAALAVSASVVLGTSAGALLLRYRLFSLPRSELRFVMAVHLARIAAMAGLAALAWWVAMPQVPIGWWVLLTAIRLLLSRLPLIANKDLAFAAVAVLLLGNGTELAALMTMWAALLFAAHVVLGLLLSVSEIAGAGAKG
jgi:hypothetical protein